MRFERDVVIAAAVVGAVVVLSLLARAVHTSERIDHQAPQKGRQLVSQAAEWLRLSEQDSVPLFAYRHAAFSVAYVQSARLLLPDSELQKQGTDVHALATRAEARLVSMAKKITKRCGAAGINPEASKDSGISWL